MTDSPTIVQLHIMACANISLARLALLSKSYCQQYRNDLIKHHTVLITIAGCDLCDDSDHDVKVWVLNGVGHCETGPAAVCENGAKMWIVNGKEHRADGPSLKLPNGYKHWRQNNEYHREDGPAWFYYSMHHYYLRGKLVMRAGNNTLFTITKAGYYADRAIMERFIEMENHTNNNLRCDCDDDEDAEDSVPWSLLGKLNKNN